jgi:nitrite reductase (cytochrome c-552)
LAHGLDKALTAQLLLKDIFHAHNATPPELPDVSTLEKAQAYIGLDMTTLVAQKKRFLAEVVPNWLAEAQKEGRI